MEPTNGGVSGSEMSGSPAPGSSMGNTMMSSGGLMSILDLSFSKFITVGIIKFVYALLLIAVAIGYVLLVIGGFSQGVLAGIGLMVVGLIFALIEVIFIRMWLELIVVIFKIGENVSKIAQSGVKI